MDPRQLYHRLSTSRATARFLSVALVLVLLTSSGLFSGIPDTVEANHVTPTAEISPKRVRPGSLVWVSGGGWDLVGVGSNGEDLPVVRIDFYWDSGEGLRIYDGDTTVNSGGGFVSRTVAGRPGVLPGLHTITVWSVLSDGTSWESATATVTVEASNWSNLPPNGPNASYLMLEGASAGWVDGRSELVVANGHSLTDIDTTMVYDAAWNVWRPLVGSGGAVVSLPGTTDAPRARAEAAGATGTVVGSGRFFVFGGRTKLGGTDSGFTLPTEVDQYNPYTNQWTTMAPMPTARAGLGAAENNGVVYLVGGRTGRKPHQPSPLASNEAYDIYTNTWTIKAPMPVPMSDVGATTALGGKVYVFGGWTGTQVSSLVQRYDPATDTWEIMTPMPTRRSTALAAACNGVIYIFGGLDDNGSNLDTIEVFVPDDPSNITISDGSKFGGRWYTVPDFQATIEDDARLLQEVPGYTVGSEFAISSVSDGSNVYFIGGGSFDIDEHRVYRRYVCPNPTLYSAAAVDANTSMLAGGTGTLSGTTSGGTTWGHLPASTISHLFDVALPSASTAWAVGASGAIQRTTDGGATWTSQTPPTGATTVTLNGVAAPSTSTAWAVGNPSNAWNGGLGTDLRGTILRTIDGGVNWTPQNSGTARALNEVAAVSTTVAWAVGNNGTILATSDGATWLPQTSGTGQHLYGIGAFDASTAWAVGASGVIRKTGGGAWTPQTSGTTATLYEVAVVDANTAWAVGANGTVLLTTNGGAAWTSKTTGTTRTLYSVAAKSAATAWVVGEAGVTLKTTDGGTTWSVQLGGAFDLVALPVYPPPPPTAATFPPENPTVSPVLAGRPVATGRPGEQLTISGTGFLPQAGGEKVAVMVDRAGSTSQFSLQTLADGTFSTQFSVPSVAAGEHSLIAVGTVSGLVAGRSSKNLTVTPFITGLTNTTDAACVDPDPVNPKPTCGQAGDTIEILGWDFGSDPLPGNRKVNIGPYTPLPDLNVLSWTDDKIAITLPNPILSGSLSIAPPGTASNSVCLRVGGGTGPCIYPMTQTSRPGHVVTIAGEGFDPNENVTLRFEEPGGSVVATTPITIPADIGGEFTATMTVPLSAVPGPHGVVAMRAGTTTPERDSTLLRVYPGLTCVTAATVGSALQATLTGKNLGASQGESRVLFTVPGGSDMAASSMVSWSNGQVVATVPAGFTAGSVTVVVAGERSNALRFPPDSAGTSGPAITCVSPNQADPGQTIKLTGLGFGADPGVGRRTTTSARVIVDGINPLPEDSFLSWSDTEIRFSAPSGAANGNITVVRSGTSNAVPFEFFPAQGSASLVSVSPASQQVTKEVTVSGSGFGPNQVVKLFIDGNADALITTPAVVTVGTDGRLTPAKVFIPTGTLAGDHKITVAYRGFPVTAGKMTARQSPVTYLYGAEVTVDSLSGPSYLLPGTGSFTKNLYFTEGTGRRVMGLDLATKATSILADLSAFGASPAPRGMVVPGGDFGTGMYVALGTPSAGVEVVKISTLGEVTGFLSGPGAGDLAFPPPTGNFPTDRLFVSEPGASKVRRVDKTGTVVSDFATDLGNPRYLAFGPAGSNGLERFLLVSDSTSGTIWKVDKDGVKTEYATIGAGVSGLAFSPQDEWGARSTLYAGNSTTGALYKVTPRANANCGTSAETCKGDVVTFASGLPELAGIAFVRSDRSTQNTTLFDLFVLDDPDLLIKITPQAASPALVVQPTAAPTGSVISVSGTGVGTANSASTSVSIRLGGVGGARLARAVPDFSGAFVVTFPVPGGLTGFPTLVAVDDTSNTQVGQDMTFTVGSASGGLPTGAPTVTMTPSKGKIGDLISLVGANLGATQAIQVYFDASTTTLPTTPASKTTGSSGEFSDLTFRVPENVALGQHLVSVIGGNGGRSVSLLLTVEGKRLAFTPWNPQVGGTTQQLNAVASAGTTAWAVGNGGTILKTGDGGLTWTAQTSGTTQHLRAVAAVSATTAWAVGDNGTILKTADGASWSPQTSPVNKALRGVAAASTTVAWAVGDDGTLLKTSNGTSWTAQASGTAHLRAVAAASATVAWAVGDGGTILKTADGSAWGSQASSTGQTLRAVAAASATVAWAVGDAGTILNTADGNAWTTQTSNTGQALRGVAAASTTAVWAVGDDGTIRQTGDGGTFWVSQRSGTTEMLNGISAVDGSSAWAVGSNGTVLRKTVGGSAVPQQPVRGGHGFTLGQQPVVAVQEAGNTAATDGSTVVTLRIKAGTGTPGASLTCTGGLTKQVSAGVAAFSGCAIDLPGNGYVLEATASGIALGATEPFSVALAGDADSNCQVGLADFIALVNSFGKQADEAEFSAVADMNGDNIVNIQDYSVLLALYGVFTCPTLALSQNAGPAGSEVTLTGAGYELGKTVTIVFDGTEIATDPVTVTADGTGAFINVKIVVPGGATTGSHTIKASQRSGRVVAGQVFTVQ